MEQAGNERRIGSCQYAAAQFRSDVRCMAIEIPAEMLSRLTKATLNPVKQKHRLVMADDIIQEHSSTARHVLRFRSPTSCCDLRRRPWRAAIRPTHHHRIGA